MMESLKGHLLIARPELQDPNFAKSVSLLIQHDEDGAVGLILNRPTPMTVREVAEQIVGEPLDWDKPICQGGPVEGPAFVLHTRAELADDEVLPGLYSTLEADKLRECIRQQVEPCRVVANYAGWGAGQLEAEIEEDAWHLLPADLDHVFRESDVQFWHDLMKQIRQTSLVDLLDLPGAPNDPRMN